MKKIIFMILAVCILMCHNFWCVFAMDSDEYFYESFEEQSLSNFIQTTTSTTTKATITWTKDGANGSTGCAYVYQQPASATATMNVNFPVYRLMTLKSGATYKLSAWIKVDEVPSDSSIYFIFRYNNTFEDGSYNKNSVTCKNIKVTNPDFRAGEWCYFEGEYVFNPKISATFTAWPVTGMAIRVNGAAAAGNFYLDDFRVVEVDDPYPEISEIQIDESNVRENKTVELLCTADDLTDNTVVKAYIDEGEEYRNVTLLDNRYTFTSDDVGKDFVVSFSPVDSEGNVGVSKYFRRKVKSELELNSEIVNKTDQMIDMTFSFDNDGNEDYPLKLVLALFDADNVMQNYTVKNLTMESKSCSSEPISISCFYDGWERAKLFMWGTEPKNMVSYKDYVLIEK